MNIKGEVASAAFKYFYINFFTTILQEEHSNNSGYSSDTNLQNTLHYLIQSFHYQPTVVLAVLLLH